jgi:regulatory protein
LKARALQWLAQREHSRSELRRKLLRHATLEARAMAAMPAAGSAMPAEPAPAESAPAARVDALLDWLEAHQYLSQERFVESRVHARAARFGNLRIRQELKQHQVALSPDATRALAETELPRARAVRERKFTVPPASAAERARQARFLARRGFSPEVIGRVLREAATASDSDADADADAVAESDAD